jgi:hypothetical protein
MRPQIGGTAPDSELEQHNGARSINWGHGDDIIIAGAVSEWVKSEVACHPLRHTYFEGALKVLASVGALPPPNAKGEYAKTVRIPGVKPSRLYEINQPACVSVTASSRSSAQSLTPQHGTRSHANHQF